MAAAAGLRQLPHDTTRAECQARRFTISAVPEGARLPPGLDTHARAALSAATQLAQLTRRLATDRIPVDDAAATMLRGLVRGGQPLTPYRLSQQYGERGDRAGLPARPRT
jgi:hypothetical protein